MIIPKDTSWNICSWIELQGFTHWKESVHKSNLFTKVNIGVEILLKLNSRLTRKKYYFQSVKHHTKVHTSSHTHTPHQGSHTHLHTDSQSINSIPQSHAAHLLILTATEIKQHRRRANASNTWWFTWVRLLQVHNHGQELQTPCNNTPGKTNSRQPADISFLSQ